MRKLSLMLWRVSLLPRNGKNQFEICLLRQLSQSLFALLCVLKFPVETAGWQ
jgi:hypothetical protein